MLTRILTGVVLATVVLSVILVGPPIAHFILVGLVCFGALYEFHKLTGLRNDSPFGFALFGTLCLYVFFLSQDSVKSLMIVAIMVLLGPLDVFSKGKNEQISLRERFYKAIMRIFGFLYVLVPLSFMLKLFKLPDSSFWFLVAIACTALGDTFAFFGGKTFGKKKLAPEISPNKTWEGAYFAVIGGIVGSLVVHVGFGRLDNILYAIALGVILSIFGILGDLVESALKRAHNVKDSGNILPGHGGILDRIDAYLVTLPMVYFITQWSRFL